MAYDAKQRLDRLIDKAKTKMYKPFGIAEVLYHNRVVGDLSDLSDIEDYRRRSEKWMREVFQVLELDARELNSKYWDDLVKEDVLPAEKMVELGELNRSLSGIVEEYIYGRIRDKFLGIASIKNTFESITTEEFTLSGFLSSFREDERFKRSIDKAYEIVVYALFNAVTRALRATVTLKIDEGAMEVLRDFEQFAKLVLGVDIEHPQISQPARLFRVGTANAADAGLDMWANFGPAVQVKHMSLSPDEVGDICNAVQADQVIVVCRNADAERINLVLQQFGLGQKLRGMITEIELEE